MNLSTSQTTWHGQDAWVLENDTIRTVVVPSMGAKLVSLFDKRANLEWLVGPGDRPFEPVPYGAVFAKQDMSGWDEMFPTIVSCPYPAPGKDNGQPLPDHGEVWCLPWDLEPAPLGSLRFSVQGRALPYRLARTLALASPDRLDMYYRLENLGQASMPYIWTAHPQFVCGDKTQILFPSHVTRVCNTIPAEWGWGEPDTEYDWPEAVKPCGQRVRIDLTGPASLRQARKFFLPPRSMVSWMGLVRHPSLDWICLQWDPTQVPYLGLWVDEGAISHETVAAPEPTTGYYDSLALAWDKREVATIAPGASHTWTLEVRLGTGEQPFPLDAHRPGQARKGVVK